MKRTKETYFKEHPEWVQREAISGCREFDGEDLKYDSRKEFFKNKQKEWLDQQLLEKKERQAREKLEELMYAQQTLELNRMRGMLEDNFTKTKSDILKDTTTENQRLDLERKRNEEQRRAAQLKYEKEQAQYLKLRGTKQQFHMDVL